MAPSLAQVEFGGGHFEAQKEQNVGPSLIQSLSFTLLIQPMQWVYPVLPQHWDGIRCISGYTCIACCIALCCIA